MTSPCGVQLAHVVNAPLTRHQGSLRLEGSDRRPSDVSCAGPLPTLYESFVLTRR